MYLIEFLHQTTTVKSCSCTKSRCILLNFYIKPQLKPSKDFDQAGCILLNFYIKPQQCILAAFDRMVVSYWISTSNHNIEQSEYNGIALYLIEFLHQTTTGPYLFAADRRCILLNFYIKPQHVQTVDVERCGCILLNFYIKPQLKPSKDFDQAVVSYWISTSNHNLSRRSLPPSPVVSYWISTSNHNFIPIVSYSQGLYLIEFLHQTTTTSDLVLILGMLYLIEFLHQTTTYMTVTSFSSRCILLNFYIKPQLVYWTIISRYSCILLNFYIKPQLFPRVDIHVNCCILLNFYIKPQQVNIETIEKICCILLNFYIKPQQCLNAD